MTHIYDWIETASKTDSEAMVKKFLDFKTRGAYWQMKNKDKEPSVKCFCVYKNKKLKITGASRLGDVWLSKDFSRVYGYDYRVAIDDCIDFSFEIISNTHIEKLENTQ